LECGGSTPLSFFFPFPKQKESGVEPPHSKNALKGTRDVTVSYS